MGNVRRTNDHNFSGFVYQPTKAWFSPEERRAAREALLAVLPNANKKRFFEKNAKLVSHNRRCLWDVFNVHSFRLASVQVTRAEQLEIGHVFDRCIIGFGPQGLMHLDSILQVVIRYQQAALWIGRSTVVQ